MDVEGQKNPPAGGTGDVKKNKVFAYLSYPQGAFLIRFKIKD